MKILLGGIVLLTQAVALNPRRASLPSPRLKHAVALRGGALRREEDLAAGVASVLIGAVGTAKQLTPQMCDSPEVRSTVRLIGVTPLKILAFAVGLSPGLNLQEPSSAIFFIFWGLVGAAIFWGLVGAAAYGSSQESRLTKKKATSITTILLGDGQELEIWTLRARLTKNKTTWIDILIALWDAIRLLPYL